MKILHTVQLYYPHTGGSEEVVKQLSERLVRRGHEVVVATGFDPRRDFQELNGVEVEQFKISGSEVNGIVADPKATKRYQDFVEHGDWDVMMNYAAQTWLADLVFPLLPKIKFAKVFVPCGYSGLHWPTSQDYFRRMPEVLRNYDAHVYMSPNYQDKKFADQNGLKNTLIVPNAASEEEFAQKPLGFRQRYKLKTKYVLLTVANHYVEKGHTFVLNAFRKLGRTNVTLVIIGRPAERWWAAPIGFFAPLRLGLDILGRPSERWGRGGCYLDCKIQSLLNSRIKVLNDFFRPLPREWAVSAFQEADIFVFGSSIECSPLVILEAMAAGIPFVSTNCGDVSDRKEFGRIINKPSEMAREINNLLDNEKERAKLGKSARKEWKKRYTWEAVTDQYEDLYKRLVSAKG